MMAIPKALAERPQWLCWRFVDTGKPRLGKPPVSPRTGMVCAKNDESEFTTLHDALMAMEKYDLDGVGFVFTGGFVCIDLDDAFGEDNRLTPVAQDVFDHFSNTYWEYSPSGNGLHGFMYGVKPNERTKDSALGIEVYSGYNFVTVTGDHVDGTNANAVDMQTSLDWLYETYLPPLVSTKAEQPVDHGDKEADEWLAIGLSKDEKLQALYNATDHSGDESSTDFSLLAKLTYWLNRDAAAIEAAFLASPWAKSKDKAHAKKLDRKDYLPDSIAKAIALSSVTATETDRQYSTRAIRFFLPTPQEDGTDEIALTEYTDLGNAKAMAAIYGDILCYTPEWGWCFFNGVRWETDVSYRAMEAAREVAEALMSSAKDWLERVNEEVADEGLSPEDAKPRLKPAKDFYAHALKTQSEHGITAMVRLNEAYMIASAKQFNADPWLLNTPSGVVDLKTGEIMPHDGKYRITACTAIAPEAGATPMFDAFLSKVFCGDTELIRFVKTHIGSALIGKVYSENLIIANGNGSNGKSTLFNTIQYILGDYATSIDPDLLMSSKASEQQVGMAMLEGRRFAVAQETEEGQRLRSSMLKRLVSTDTMVAKKLYKDPHEFVPSHTLVLSTNHLPKVSSTDTGTWRRIVVVPFNATFAPSETITDYHSVLMAREGGTILRWAIEGAVAYWENDCNIPEKPAAVIQASQDYRSAEDWVSNFLEECCRVVGPNDESVWVRHDAVYHEYQRWARDNGEYAKSSNCFSRALITAGWHGRSKHYDNDTNSLVKIWFGFALNEAPRHITLVQTEDKRKRA